MASTNELFKEKADIDRKNFIVEKSLEIVEIDHALNKNDIKTKYLLGVYEDSEVVPLLQKERDRYLLEKEDILDSLM